MAIATSCRVLSLLSIVGLLSGCASAFAPVARFVGPSESHNAPQSAPRDVYVSQSDGAGKSIVFEFGAQNVQNGAPKCSIKGLRDVLGLGSDSAGNVFIPSGAT